MEVVSMTIYADIHEPDNLRKPFVTMSLPSGDYMIDATVLSTGEHIVVKIERKTITDFWGSLQSGRLQDQMSRCDILLLDVSSGFTSAYINTSALYGAINGISIKNNIPIMFGVTHQDIIKTLKRYEMLIEIGEWHTLRVPIVKMDGETSVRILSQVPGIGVTKAKLLLRRYGTLRKVLNELGCIGELPAGIGQSIIDGINNALDEEYHEA